LQGSHLRQGVDGRYGARPRKTSSGSCGLGAPHGLPCYPGIRRTREWRQGHRVPKTALCDVHRRRAARVRPVARMVARPLQPRGDGGYGRVSAAPFLAWRGISVLHRGALVDENELVRNILLATPSSLAKLEREKISQRTKAGLERARARGKVLRRPKLGNGDRDRLIAALKSGDSWHAVSKATRIP